MSVAKSFSKEDNSMLETSPRSLITYGKRLSFGVRFHGYVKNPEDGFSRTSMFQWSYF
jgi:hypothetical protein